MPKYTIHQHIFGHRPGDVVESDEAGWETLADKGLATRHPTPRKKADKTNDEE